MNSSRELCHAKAPPSPQSECADSRSIRRRGLHHKARLGIARAVFLACVLTQILLAANPPQFRDFPTNPTFHGQPASPHFRPAEDGGPNHPGRFRSSALFETAHGPNFAGHFTLVSWTCGSGCAQIAVVDAATGRIFRHMPFQTLVRPDLRQELKPLAFRLDSRLLIAQGYFDNDAPNYRSPCTRRAYLWTGSAFRLLHKTPLACTPQP